MKKQFQYVFIKGSCPYCGGDPVKDFWTFDGNLLYENHAHCPNCRKNIFDEYGEVLIISKDPVWHKTIQYSALHILHSEERTFCRPVEDKELIKKHGVEAHWFRPGREVYIEPPHLYSDEIKEFIRNNLNTEKVLVYIPNSHLQRLYFFVPNDAIHHL
jgi:RNA polymerase subunit RPABC4/transcription elongation factor Spt4